MKLVWFHFLLQVLVPFLSWSRSRSRSQSRSWTKPGPVPWSRSRFRNISGPGLRPGPGPIMCLVPALVPVPVPVKKFGPVTQWHAVLQHWSTAVLQHWSIAVLQCCITACNIACIIAVVCMQFCTTRDWHGPGTDQWQDLNLNVLVIFWPDVQSWCASYRSYTLNFFVQYWKNTVFCHFKVTAAAHGISWIWITHIYF